MSQSEQNRDPATVQQPEPKVRWYRFRLRMLLVVLTIIAVMSTAFVSYVSLLCGLKLSGEYSVLVQ
jgi:hypothetical protein